MWAVPLHSSCQLVCVGMVIRLLLAIYPAHCEGGGHLANGQPNWAGRCDKGQPQVQPIASHVTSSSTTNHTPHTTSSTTNHAFEYSFFAASSKSPQFPLRSYNYRCPVVIVVQGVRRVFLKTWLKKYQNIFVKLQLAIKDKNIYTPSFTRLTSSYHI